MTWVYLISLFVLSMIGGSIPFMLKQFRPGWMTMILAFSGSFLLGITLLHLLPETIHELGEKAGLYILIGFFIQLILQRLSHGVEHGHIHEPLEHMESIVPILFGLSIHAFMEGIPLGFNYQQGATLPAIFLGVSTHKIPEAITLSTLILHSSSRNRKWMYLLGFALVSPISALLAMIYGQQFHFVSSLLVYIIPLVIGSFLHISTTVLYESGTRHHELSRQKVIAVALGLCFALATLLFHHH